MILAVHLKEAGYDVGLCEIDRVKVELIQKEGIHLDNVIKKHSYFKHIYTSIEDLKNMDPDILIFSIKSHQMHSIAQEADIIKSDKLNVISAQNGIDTEETLSEVFGVSNTLRMVINYAGNLNAPNAVKVTFFNPPNYIGSIGNDHDEIAEQVAGSLTDVGLKTDHIDSSTLNNKVWEKAILNCSLSALCGIVNYNMKEIMNLPETMELVEQTIRETVNVAQAKGLDFNENFIKHAMKYLHNTGEHYPSLALDIINRNVTEIDYFNGKVVEYGRKLNVPTPLNLTITNMVKAITQKGREERGNK